MPSSARYLDLIQKSPLALDARELKFLDQNGFVLSPRAPSDTFARVYAEIYRADLPVYVSADSILESVHRSYDAILSETERTALHGEISRLLSSMREHLRDDGVERLGATAAADVDEYLAVAAALCTGQSPRLVLKGDAARARRIVERVNAASGPARESLFGSEGVLDYGLFRPRGHYEKTEELRRYFRAMIWLGAVDLRFAERERGGTVQVKRRALEGMLGLRTLLDAPALQRWAAIDEVLGYFLGPRDSIAVSELDTVVQSLGAADAASARSKSDAEWSAALSKANLGAQRIEGKIREEDPARQRVPGLPSFALFGQRATADSAVFSELTYDRLAIENKPKRLMPSPLDVGYAVFGNATARALLAEELETYGYAQELERLRSTTDTHAPSLYSLWLGSLAALSNSPQGSPKVATTEAWGRRILNTQLSSWAELRHNTVLYAKQSVSASISCEYPDAYVDPYPEFYETLESYAKLFAQVSEFSRHAFAGEVALKTKSYSEHLESVAGTLKGMAVKELRGEPFSDAEMKFVNEAVVVDNSDVGCGGGVPHLLGWYARLFYDSDASLLFEPTIADVHTQPTDAGGNKVGRILHVGTGAPRTIVVTVDTCRGPSAYVGPAFSYYELTTERFVRLTDSDWRKMLSGARSPEWLSRIMP